MLTKAAPKLDPLNRQRDYAIEGEPPSPIHTPTGCKFHPRCPYCTDKCRSEVPELKEIAPGPPVRLPLSTLKPARPDCAPQNTRR